MLYCFKDLCQQFASQHVKYFVFLYMYMEPLWRVCSADLNVMLEEIYRLILSRGEKILVVGNHVPPSSVTSR